MAFETEGGQKSHIRMHARRVASHRIVLVENIGRALGLKEHRIAQHTHTGKQCRGANLFFFSFFCLMFDENKKKLTCIFDALPIIKNFEGF